MLAANADAEAAPRVPVRLEFSIRLDPATRMLHGEGTIETPPGAVTAIRIGERFEVREMRSGGRPLARDRAGAWTLPASTGVRKVSARWEGRLDPIDTTLDHRQTLDALTPVTGPEGTFLPAGAGWHPGIDGALVTWRIAIDLPAGQRGLVPGRLLEESDDARGYRARFEFASPAEGIDLMAGPYAISERTLKLDDGRTVRLRTYFERGLEALADGYLGSSADYIRLYDSWIGPYPFTEFSVVSSPTPTGFGMPTLTYLGADVLKLPFIRATSLGHEVLHNWWGNGVYPDYARGNWSEGLTTFMADYQYKLREGDAAAREMRLGWLRDFAAVPPGQDRPLAEFTSRTHGTSQIVGYHKAAMVFLMLQDAIGAESFARGARQLWNDRRFQVTSWDDLRGAFERSTTRDLGWFFSQWTTRAGAPRVRIDRAQRREAGGRWRVRLTLAQETPAYRLQVPLTIVTDRGDVERTVELGVASRSVEFVVPGWPRKVILDRDLRLFRRLGPDEAPPILRDVMVNPQTRALVLAPDSAWRNSAQALLARLLDGPPRIVASERDAAGSPLIVIGTREDVDRFRMSHAAADGPAAPANGSAQVWTERASGAVRAFIVARDPEALSALARPLPHYGKQSWLIFDGAKASARGVWPPKAAERGFD